jgi:hypothetical protein
VWVGEAPATDAEARNTYLRMASEYLESDETFEPHPALVAFCDELLSHWPDITTDAGDDSPWSDGPLANNITGPLFYFGMSYSQADDAIPWIVQVARRRGLVCFDPQSEWQL